MVHATVFVVDDDVAVGKAISSASRLLGHPVQSFTSAKAFLSSYESSQPGCLVLDIKMPEMTGLELQKRLRDQGWEIPVVVVSGHADVRTAVEAMSLGALTLLEKPFRLEELIAHLRRALALDAENRSTREKRAEADRRHTSLTVKEREVFDLIAAGKTNREIAEHLGISLRAVEDRRGRLMRKVGARTVAELIRLLPDTDRK